jgi:hypothetical protein
MAEVADKTAEEIAAEEAAALQQAEAQVAEAQALKDFTEGFTDVKVELTEDEKKAAEDAAIAEKAAQDDADRVAAAAKVAEVKLATPSEREFQDLVRKANGVDDIRALAEKVRDTTNGRVGSLEQMIKKLQETTPTGQSVVATPEDFAEIGKDMPDHAKMLADGLTRVLSKFKGTGSTAPAETPEAFNERVNQAADERLAKRDAEREATAQSEARSDLGVAHPDWETVVGPKDSTTEFRTYLKTQPALYEKHILGTNDAYILSEALTKFKDVQDAKKKPKPPVVNTARHDRLREAVQVRGGAAPLNTNREKSDLEQFAEGFTS